MTSFRSVFWSVFVFPFSFPSLDILLLTYAFSWSLLRSSRCILPILACFLALLRAFLDSLYAFYFKLSLVALSLSFQPIFTQNPLSLNLSYNNFLRLTKLYCCCWFPAQKASCKLFDYAASHLLLTTLYGGQLTFSTHLLTLTYLLTSTRPREALV